MFKEMKSTGMQIQMEGVFIEEAPNHEMLSLVTDDEGKVTKITFNQSGKTLVVYDDYEMLKLKQRDGKNGIFTFEAETLAEIKFSSILKATFE